MANSEKFKLALKHIKKTGKLDTQNLKNLSNDEKQIIYTLYNKGLLDESSRLIESLDSDKDWNAIKKELPASEKQVMPIWKSVLKYAAIFVGLATTFFLIQQEENLAEPAPLFEKAITLKIGEKSLKVINENDSQNIISSNGEVIGTQKGNTLSYNTNSKIDELTYNELEVPLGKIFNVELSDGTLVHLNSGTKIKYPIKFLQGDNREVFIQGEAYFKVAKDTRHPFIVNADAVAVEVLGTEFNITSYPEDHVIKTVLVEGSVDMTNSYAPNENTILKPGNKGSWHKVNRKTKIEEVDVEMYTGWITGELIFRNLSFEEISTKLERRYNIIIENNNAQLASKILTARFNVNVENIEDILKSLKQITPFNYQIIDRKILID
ncbi:FecR family protein [Flavobacteriaceae bacterium MAR_2009_75]|nr:FecR family protein [Flavobacteriaceae bacterium MAR_2009_75]